MIRNLRKADVNKVSDIWLNTNLEVHDFIPARYWEDNFRTVQEMFGQAEVYVYEGDSGDGIHGFIGLDGEYIAGIFVRNGSRSDGVGKQLLEYVKGMKQRLYLNVYQKNKRAVKFYQRENFVIQGEGIDESTGEKEYSMTWGGGTMSKYQALWEYIRKDGRRSFKLTFEEVQDIAGIPIDHSFLKYKKELTEYGYEVGKISMKERTIIFNKAD